MKLAIVGLGKIADYHIQAISCVPAFELVGGMDLNPAAATKLPVGCLFYNNLRDLLSQSHIDAVVLTVPGGAAKFELSKEILASDRNLITEKPAVSSLRELDELISIAQQHKVFLHGAFHSRYSPTARFIFNLLHSEEYLHDPIHSIQIWADSPHIINGSVMSKSSEDTSFNAEGPNVISEMLMYAGNAIISIDSAESVTYSASLPEVHTQIHGHIGGASFATTTSWIRGIKQKGVAISFSSGRELKAVHTDQLITNENNEVIYDGKLEDPSTSRMQKEYNLLYRTMGYTDSILDNDNSRIIAKVAGLMEEIKGKTKEISQELVPRLA